MAEEQDLQTFIRDQDTRMERAVQNMERSLERMGDRMDRNFERWERESADQRDQLRANTAATWAMVDEIRGPRG